MIDLVLERSGAARGQIVVGLDFAFSFPGWFLREKGARTARELWELVAAEGEEWLRTCPLPFWGRPGKPRPELESHLRATDSRLAPVGRGIRPKSPFQVGGAGSVGTSSLRGMPALLRLRDGGFAIWPFEEPALPLVVEIWPRLLTGPVVKSDPEERERYLRELGPGMIAGALADLAGASEDAFDAAVSAVVMSAHGQCFASLGLPASPLARLEGEIWVPPPSQDIPPERANRARS